MYKIRLIKEIPNNIPSLEVGSLLIVKQVLSNGKIRAIPAEDIINKNERFRRDYVLFPDEYEEIT